jgi:quercetin dioxygenase-like cupin family protein
MNKTRPLRNEEVFAMNARGTPRSGVVMAAIFAMILGALVFTSPAHAFSFNPIGLGQLPNGEWVEQYTVTFDPGEVFPWHFHPGFVAAIMVTGELTEDHGCGEAPIVHSEGEAFTEKPGAVHMVTNEGTVPATVAVSGTLPQCYGDFHDSIFVDGPTCNGKSGQSKILRVPPCP